jgi:hypothetical protein
MDGYPNGRTCRVLLEIKMLKLAKNRVSNSALDSKLGIGQAWVRIATDTCSLAELQFQLFQLDAKTWLATTGLTLAALALGLVFALSGVFALFGVAIVGLTLTGLHLLWSLLIVGGVAILAGGLLTFIAISRLRRSLAVFKRSQTEMAQNLHWLKKQFSDNHQ